MCRYGAGFNHFRVLRFRYLHARDALGLHHCRLLQCTLLVEGAYVVCQCETLFITAAVTLGIVFGLWAYLHRNAEAKPTSPAANPRKHFIVAKTVTIGSYLFVKGAVHLGQDESSNIYPPDVAFASIEVLPEGLYVCLAAQVAMLFVGYYVQWWYTHQSRGCGRFCTDEGDDDKPVLEQS